MKVSEQTVMELAKACRLSLTEDETVQYARDIDSLETLAAALFTAEGDSGDWREALPLSAWRTDEAVSRSQRDALLKSAPHAADGYITVPRTVEES